MAFDLLGGMEHADAGEEAELHSRASEGEGTRDKGLGGDDGGEAGEDDESQGGRAGGGEREEGVSHGARIAKDMGALTEVAEHEGGQDEGEPREPDGLDAEVAHVGVEGLAAGDGEDDGSKNMEAGPAVVGEVFPGVVGRKGGEDFGIEAEVIGSKGADRQEPNDHNWTEKFSDGAGALALNRKKSDENYATEGYDKRGGIREGDGEAFGGAEDGDGRGDDAIAIEKRGTHDGDESDDGDAAGFGGAEALWDKGEKSEDTAFAVIVGLHDEREILDADNEDEGPEDEGENSVQIGLGGVVSTGGVEALFERVEGTGANVAEDDA